MNRQFVFISCGQFTEAEKCLGKQVADMVRKRTGLATFFADEVQDLNGLDDNILRALRDCVAFITVLHPRGKIERPDGSTHIRASVWIEQEIAIATYIQRVEKRSIPIIAFKHASVDREGVRDLLQLNPIEFTDEAEVLAELPKRLELLKDLSSQDIQLQLRSVASRKQDDHVIRQLEVTLVNDTNQRITQYSCLIELPSGILKHWNAHYVLEIRSQDPTRRFFRLTESNKGPLEPRDRIVLATFEYCTQCALETSLVISTLVGSPPVKATVFINNREYSAEKTIPELAVDAERLGTY
ncbi:MAG: hypothetical protein WBD87_15420 [Candidatus Acidiferrales bacterium]